VRLICRILGHKKTVTRLGADEPACEIEKCKRCGVVVGVRITSAGRGWPDRQQADRYRHKIRGTVYRVLYEAAKAQSSIIAIEDMTMVVYQGEADGLVWVRPAVEFFDGRFERLPD
jgi:hypothetical protein